MQQLYLNNFFYKDPTTGEFIPVAGIAGESAYEIAVRLGFDGTEAQFLESLKGEDGKILASPHLIENMTIHLGSELYDHSNTTDVTLGDGWTKTEDGYTHSANTSGELAIPISGATVGETYLVRFNTDYTADEFINVGIGTGYRVLCYNGRNDIILPLTAYDDTTLHISLHTTGETKDFTLSNFSIKHIQETGEEYDLAIYSVLSDNHNKNYGFWNVMLGINAEGATSGTRNIVIGHQALADMQGGHRNIAIGTFAGSDLIGGENNIMIGADTMFHVKKGNRNVCVGQFAMYDADGAEDSVSIGSSSLQRAQNTFRNVVIGGLAGGKLSSETGYNKGCRNTFIGYRAGSAQIDGTNCVVVGNDANGLNGKNCGDNVIIIGANAVCAIDGIANAIVIGANAKATKSNQMMLGNDAITEVVFCGNKKINFNDDGTVTWEILT